MLGNVVQLCFEVAHLALLSSFPFFSVSSVPFILSVIMVRHLSLNFYPLIIPVLALVGVGQPLFGIFALWRELLPVQRGLLLCGTFIRIQVN